MGQMRKSASVVTRTGRRVVGRGRGGLASVAVAGALCWRLAGPREGRPTAPRRELR